MTDHDRAQAITNRCQCNEGYTCRQLIDPQCAYHAYAEEIVEALAAVRLEERKRWHRPAKNLVEDCIGTSEARDALQYVIDNSPLEPPT